MNKKIAIISILSSTALLAASALLAFGITKNVRPIEGEPEYNNYVVEINHDSIIAGSQVIDDEWWCAGVNLKQEFKVGAESFYLESLAYDDYDGSYYYGTSSFISFPNDGIIKIASGIDKMFNVYFDILSRATIDYNNSFACLRCELNDNTSYHKVYIEDDDSEYIEDYTRYWFSYCDSADLNLYNHDITVEYFRISFSCVI